MNLSNEEKKNLFMLLGKLADTASKESPDHASSVKLMLAEIRLDIAMDMVALYKDSTPEQQAEAAIFFEKIADKLESFISHHPLPESVKKTQGHEKVRVEVIGGKFPFDLFRM